MSNFNNVKSHGEESSKHTAVGPIYTGPTTYERVLEAYERQRSQAPKPTKPAAKAKPKPTKPTAKPAGSDEAETLQALRQALYIE